ncbi:MAG: N-acetylmuramoyl-L-alanine amidase [Dehalococcoidia bacterium]
MTPLPAGEASGTPAPPAAQASPTRSPQPSPGPLATGSPRAAIAPQPPSPLPPRTDRSGFVVALDPGHGGDESGAAANGVVERDSNLDLAMRVGEFLKTAGVQVYYTRTDGGRAPGIGGNGDTRSLTRNDLQARVTAANRAGADVFVSLHSNGAADTSLRGVEVYYESRRPFADQNYRLAQNLIDGALRGLANSGNPSVNRGIIDAACWRNFQGRCVGLFVLSPGGTTTGSGGSTGQVKEATNMPAALLETLFVSSPEDAALLRDDAVRTAVARGIAEGILRFLGVLA